MDVFCWLQQYVTHTRQPSVEYQTLMFVLLKYGVPVEQKFIDSLLVRSSLLAALLQQEVPERQLLALQCIDSFALRKLVSKGCWEWCYTSVYSLLKKAASEATKENVGYLLQCLKTSTSLLALQPPPIAADLLHLLKPLLTFGMLSVPLSSTGPKSSSGDEVSSDEEWGGRQGMGQGASSESEISDSEYAMSVDAKSRSVTAQVRQQAYHTLSVLLHGMDRKEVFSHWSLFLSPGPADQSPSLLTCLVKEPSSKVRMNIAVAISAFLEGTKPLLSAADDRPLQSCAFIPFSHWLGGVIRDIHRVLLLTSSTEGTSKTLLQLLKCINALLLNAPYARLSEPYQTRVASSIKPLLSHRNADVRVSCLMCYHSLLSSGCDSEVRTWLSRCASPSLLHLFLDQLPPSPQPQVVQIASLQAMAAMAKHHADFVVVEFDEAFHKLVVCLSVPELPIHVVRVFEEFWRVWQGSQELMPIDKVCSCWTVLLQGPLPLHLQGKSPPVISACCDLVSTISSDVMARLKQAQCMFVLSVMLGLAKHDTTQVQASAVRTLGVLLQYACLHSDHVFLLDALNIVCTKVNAKELHVRVQASWSLGNLCDSLREREEVLSPPVYGQVLEACLSAAKDHDRVRVHGVRALGHLLYTLKDNQLVVVKPKMQACVDVMCKTILSGAAKVRWNACHATSNALSSQTVLTSFPVGQLIGALTKSLYNCKNFKVRISAATALCTIRPLADSLTVWHGLLQAIQASDEMDDFSEFKHRSTLRGKLCELLCHLLSHPSGEQEGDTDAFLKENTGLLVQFVSSVKVHGDASEELLTKLKSTVEGSERDTVQALCSALSDQ